MKKLISIILAFMLTFSMVVFAEGEAVSADAVKDAEILNALSIIPGAVASNDPVTRGEFAYYLTYLTKAPAADYSVKFADVGAQHRFFKEIMQIVGTGAMVGKSQYLFCPDDTLTVAEAAKTFVCLLGYGDVAMYEGGYPSGYLAVAQRIELLKGISGSTLTKSSALKMIMNAIEIPWAERETYGDKPSAIIESDNTFLKTNFSLYKIENEIFSANEYSSTTSATGVMKGAALIGDVLYRNAAAIGDIPLGASVDAYFAEENGENVLKYVTLSKRCNILQLPKSDISSFTLGQVKYYAGDKELAVALSGEADFVYGGVYADVSSITANDKQNCSLTLIDKEGNGSYETIHIDVYDVYYTESVYYDNFTFKDYTSEKRFEFDPDKCDIVVYNGSSVGDFTALPVDKIISVTTSKDGSLIRMFVGTETAGGVVNETDANGFTLEGKYYAVAPGVKNAGKMPQAGDMGTVYFDKNGEVGVFISKVSGSLEWGYLVDGANESKGLSTGFKLQIFTATGEMKVFEVASKFKIDGADVNKTDKTAFDNLYIDHLDGGATKDFVVPQLIGYAINADNEVIEIDTEYKNEAYEGEDSLYSKAGQFDKSYSMDQWTGLYASKAYLDMNALTVFCVPDNYDVKDAKKFSICNWSTLYSNYGGGARLKPYNEDDVNRTKLAVSYIEVGGSGGGVDVPANTELTLVDKVSTYYSEDGELGTKIYGFFNNEYKGWPIDAEIYKSGLPAGRTNLKRGDAIQAKVDGFGNIIGYTLKYNIDNRLNFSTGLPYNNNWQTENGFFNGTVYAAIDTHYVLQYGWRETYDDAFFDSKDYYTCRINWGGFYVYDEEKDEVRLGSAVDLKGYKDYPNEPTRIYARFHWGTVTSTIIYKFKNN